MSLETEFHTELEHRVIEFLRLQYMDPIINFRLPTGRIADLILITPTREILIVEVKTSLRHSLITEACKKYRAYCNHLLVAAPEHEFNNLLPTEPATYWADNERHIGLLGIASRSVRVIRAPRYRKVTKEAYDYLRWQLRERVDRKVYELGENRE